MLAQTLKMLRSPISPLVAGVRFWLTHGARVRRARMLCQLADGIRSRRLRDWEARSNRLYRRSARGLSALAPADEGTADWGSTAARMLKQAQRPYRWFVGALLMLAGEAAVAACVLVLIACSLSTDVRHRLLPEDLAKGKPWSVRDGDSHVIVEGEGPSGKGVHFFHTENVDNPSLEIHLGAAHLIRRIRIDNRSDCCRERALPLNVEVLDGGTWRLIAQRRSYFSTWSYDVEPVRASIVRIRRPGRNFFHLKRVAIYGQ